MNNSNNEITINNKKKKVPLYKNCYVITICITLLFIFMFNLKFTIVLVSGSSMEPTYHNGDLLLAEKHTEINRFDKVIIITDNKFIIKRIIGLPGETIEYKNNNLYVNGKLIKDIYRNGNTNDFSVTISNNGYYCLGDNRENSRDSRYFGEFNRQSIFAKVIKGGN